MAAVEFEIRVAGPVPAGVLEELENIEVISQAVDTVLRGPRAGPGHADRHHQPAAELGNRTVRYSTTMSPGVHHRLRQGMRQRQIAAAQRTRDTDACIGQPAEHIAQAKFPA